MENTPHSIPALIHRYIPIILLTPLFLSSLLRYFADWPDSLQWLGNALNMLNLDFVSLAQPECLGLSSTFYGRFAAIVACTYELH